MTEKNKKTYFYPRLGGRKDFWFFRLGGDGIGNGLYNYFHAYVLALKNNGVIISPPWPTLKIGPLLRGERSKRFYLGLFEAAENDVSSIRKFFTLLSYWRKRKEIELGEDNTNVTNDIKKGNLNIISFPAWVFTFDGLYEYKEEIRDRFMEIIQDEKSQKDEWGKGGYIAVHVRLGDFTAVDDIEQIKKGLVNTRIPLSWYIDIINLLKRSCPDTPIRIFSDGNDKDLLPLTETGAEIYRGETDLDDLLTMSNASILVGSRSTFSYWAAFLGNMPSIWLQTENMDHKIAINDMQATQHFIALDEIPPTISFD